MKLQPIPILLYHEIGAGAGATPTNVFREHMAYLHRRGISSLALPEFESVLSGQCLPGNASVVITFDDGDRSCLTEALPILEEFNLHATAFLITGRMRDGDCELGPNKNALSWDEARALRDSGRFALQSHSHTHSRWPFDETGCNQVRDELRRSREILASELDTSLDQFSHIAWPWGRCNLLFESIAKEAGFEYQYLVQKGAVNQVDSRVRLPRLCCDGMPIATFMQWIDVLVNPIPTIFINRLAGAIRRIRHGLSYQ